MIRINLLPYKQATLIQWGQRQVMIFAAALVVSIVVCVIWYSRLPDPEAAKRKLVKERQKYETMIKEVNDRHVCSKLKLKKQLKLAVRKYKTVEKLITRRSTPKNVLRELSRILSESWGPTLDTQYADKKKGSLFNQNWDPTAVWITKFTEAGRVTTIEGGAKASDDVAEFWRRLQLSVYFEQPDLEKFSKEGNKETAFLKFVIKTRVKY